VPTPLSPVMPHNAFSSKLQAGHLVFSDNSAMDKTALVAVTLLDVTVSATVASPIPRDVDVS
jgi:hypothetical protein